MFEIFVQNIIDKATRVSYNSKKRQLCRYLYSEKGENMPTKGDNTKQLIKDTAKQLFSGKGYAGVTMKDICDACNLSRGGLYRHYSSTKEIMLEILTDDKDEMKKLLECSIEKNVPAVQLFDAFLNMIRDDIQRGENRFYFVIHEFAFVESEQSEYMINRFNSAVQMLSMLLDYGKKTLEFKDFETNSMANHIVFLRDSIVTSSISLRLSDDLINLQLKLIKDMVIKNESE